MKPTTQHELASAQGGTAIYIFPDQIKNSPYHNLYTSTFQQLSKLLPIAYNPQIDRIYLNRKKPVGDAPVKTDMKYTPPTHCIRFAITMRGLENVLTNQGQYYYAYHCIYNKPEPLSILKSVVDNGFRVHPKAPNGKIHGAGTYVTPSFSTIVNFYSRQSIIQINGIKFELVLQVRVKKGSFTMHANTTGPNDDWPEHITEWLISEPNTNNIVVTGIILRNVDLIK